MPAVMLYTLINRTKARFRDFSKNAGKNVGAIAFESAHGKCTSIDQVKLHVFTTHRLNYFLSELSTSLFLLTLSSILFWFGSVC